MAPTAAPAPTRRRRTPLSSLSSSQIPNSQLPAASSSLSPDHSTRTQPPSGCSPRRPLPLARMSSASSSSSFVDPSAPVGKRKRDPPTRRVHRRTLSDASSSTFVGSLNSLSLKPRSPTRTASTGAGGRRVVGEGREEEGGSRRSTRREGLRADDEQDEDEDESELLVDLIDPCTLPSQPPTSLSSLKKGSRSLTFYAGCCVTPLSSRRPSYLGRTPT